ncbi:MAG: ATP-grasp domain-containing protein [Nanoarchaeota archaeon]
MSYKAAIISLGSVSSKWTFERMQNYFSEVDELDLKKIKIKLGSENGVFYENEPLKDYDCIYAKGSYKFGIVLRALTSMLAGKCFMPIKASSFTVGHNKILTQLKLQSAKIPTPITYMAPSIFAAKSVLDEINFPIIMKFPEGTQGKGVMFAESYAAASSMLDAFASLNQPVLIQEYIETGSTDTRVIVVGEKVVSAMQRKAVMGEKRANIHTGATGDSVTLDSLTRKIAIKTAKTMNCEVCAVDILEGVKGPRVIEINLSPGLQGITKVTKVDIADKIAKYLFEKTKEFKEQNKSNDTSDIFKDLGINVKDKQCQEIITSADFRADRLLLPNVIKNLSQIGDDDEIIIKVEKGNINITKA